MKVVWRSLVLLGAVCILIAFRMDTTVSSEYGRIHNIGLQSDRQMLLIFGCFVVIAGVVLFAVTKLKQTPEQEAAEQVAREATKAVAEEKITLTAKRGIDLLQKLKNKLRAARHDNLSGRLWVAGFVGLCTQPVSEALLEWYALPILVLLYSLRERPALELMISMLRFNTWLTLLFAVGFALMSVQMETWRLDAIGSVAVAMPVILALLLCGLSLASLQYFRRKQSSGI